MAFVDNNIPPVEGRHESVLCERDLVRSEDDRCNKSAIHLCASLHLLVHLGPLGFRPVEQQHRDLFNFNYLPLVVHSWMCHLTISCMTQWKLSTIIWYRPLTCLYMYLYLFKCIFYLLISVWLSLEYRDESIPKMLSMPIPIPAINSQFVIQSALIPMFFIEPDRTL